MGANWLVDKETSWLDNALSSEMDANTDAMWGEIDHITNPTSQLVRLLSLQIDLLLGLKVAVKVVRYLYPSVLLLVLILLLVLPSSGF